MQRQNFTFLLSVCLTLLIFVKSDVDVLSYVNPLISTGGEGFGVGSNPPGPQRPFSYLRLSPDTINWENIFIPWNHFGGYYHSDSFIRVFSHTHLVGAGVKDFGNFGVLPVVKENLDAKFLTNYGFKSRFSHSTEKVEPGYYSVELSTYKITAELTTTQYTGVHRYTFPSEQQAHSRVIIDVSSVLQPDACKDSQVMIDYGSQEITGWIHNAGGLTGRVDNVMIYFYARLNTKFSSFGVFNSSHFSPNVTSTRGTNIGAVLSDLGSSTVTLYLSVSFISVDQARKNFVSDMSVFSSPLPQFDLIKVDSQQVWRKELNRIRVTTDNRVDKVKFYTAFYHTLCSPTIYTEAGNVYVGFDRQLHSNSDFNFISDMSLWDVHRTQFPFLALMYGKGNNSIYRDIVKSLLAMFEQGGFLPKWPIAMGDGQCMIGTHSIIAITDGFAKGVNLTTNDLNTAYTAMVFAATQQQKSSSRTDLQDYLTKGYVVSEESNHAACDTVEYAYDDWALGRFIQANFPEKQEEAKVFLNRGKNYQNVFHPKYKFFVPRSRSGEYKVPKIWINWVDSDYVEGDAWHYRFFAPHDIEGLISLFNSTEYFIDQLDEFFSRSKLDPFNVVPNPYYWAGNEHDLFSVWAFNWAQRQDKTQEYARWLLQHKYTDQPDGLPGNDDYGTMSAWYIWTSIGIYPISGSSQYTLGSPIFSNVELDLYDGCTLVVNSVGNGPYVKSVHVNGKSLTDPFLYHNQHLTCTTPSSTKILITFEMDHLPHRVYNP